jgi:hypothetical protein
MKVQIAPATKSTLDDPLFVWRVFDGSRSVAWGTAPNEADAADQAEAASHKKRPSASEQWLSR